MVSRSLLTAIRADAHSGALFGTGLSLFGIILPHWGLSIGSYRTVLQFFGFLRLENAENLRRCQELDENILELAGKVCNVG
jgi:hypothetical protein